MYAEIPYFFFNKLSLVWASNVANIDRSFMKLTETPFIGLENIGVATQRSTEYFAYMFTEVWSAAYESVRVK